MPEQVATFIRDWWGFAAFIVGGLLAYSAGKERQRYKVDQIGRDVDRQGVELKELRNEVEKMRTQENKNHLHAAETVTKLIVSQGHIIERLDEIRTALAGKVDK